MPAPLLLDLTHTSHTRARTGIQRVARALHTAFADGAVPVTHDPYLGAWRPLDTSERASLAAESIATKRGAQWSLTARLRGRAQRTFSRRPSSRLPVGAGAIVVPEVFSPAVAAALPALFAAARGPRVALFHDAIALRFPELTPAKTVARFPAYLQELLAFDGIAAISNDSRDSLLDYWQWIGVASPPPVQTHLLAVDDHLRPLRETPPAARPIVLSVGSVEGRKNHLALLEACEQLWVAGLNFELHLIGLAQLQTGRAAVERIRALQAAGRALRYDGPVAEAALEAAYANCTFTVYPSLCEGFGLPVIESVARGKPCICYARGALGESAEGGGCLALDRVDPLSLADGMRQLLGSATELAALTAAARARKFRTWSHYAAGLLAWLQDLPRRG